MTWVEGTGSPYSFPRARLRFGSVMGGRSVRQLGAFAKRGIFPPE